MLLQGLMTQVSECISITASLYTPQTRKQKISQECQISGLQGDQNSASVLFCKVHAGTERTAFCT